MGKIALHPIFTVGHASRKEQEFLDLLEENTVNLVIDVRVSPKSDQLHHFNELALKGALGHRHIAYRHLPELGERREPLLNTKNTALKNSEFQGYADYMQTDVFTMGVHELLDAARYCTLALMGRAEKPEECHRKFIADALYARGAHIEHILSAHQHVKHELSPYAKIKGMGITYPAHSSSWF